ncbi:MAG: pitrilysin family protein [Gemmatimonadota bacterium]
MLAASFVAVGSLPLAAQAPLPSLPPAIGGAPAFSLPAVREWRLENGLTVWLAPMRGVPLVDVSLVVRGENRSPDEESLASIVAAVLRDGAGTRDRASIDRALSQSTIALESNVSPDAMSLSMHGPSTALGNALALLADLAIRPRLRTSDVARRRTELVERTTSERSDAAAIADRVLACLVLGSASVHKGGQPTTRLTSARVRAHHAARYRPDRAVLIVAGDFDADSARIVIAKAFGSWRGAPRTTASRPGPAAKSSCAGRDIGGVRMVHVPGATQAALRAGSLAIGRNRGDVGVHDILAALLGGPFTSRLNQALRERSGLSYGAAAEVVGGTTEGMLVMRAEADPAKADSAMALLRAELERARTDLTPTDLSRGQQFVAFGVAESVSTSRGLASRLGMFAGLGQDALARYAASIGDATLARLDEVAGRTLSPDRLHFVIAGDTAELGARVRAEQRQPR